MLEGSIEDLTKIAANSATPSHLLVELSKHKSDQIRSLVASNPNTPLETLKSLGWKFADNILVNPAFELLKLENPHSKFIQLTLARSTKTPSQVLAKLIATKNLDGEICTAVAKNTNAPIDALASLAITIFKEKDGYITAYRTLVVSGWFRLALDIIRRPDISESCLEKIIDICLERNHEYLLFKIAGLPKLSFSMLEKLSKYPEKYPDKEIEGFEELLIDFPMVKESPILLDNIARNTVGSLEFLECKEEVFLKIANNPRTLSSTIEYLAAHHSPQIRNALTKHPNISPKALDIFLLMQLKTGTPIEVLHEVAENPRFYSSVSICLYPYVPSEVIDKIGNNLPSYRRNAKYRLRLLKYLAYHPNSSLNLLQKIADELQQVSTSVANGERYYQGGFIENKLLQKIDKLVAIINRRLEGEYLAETDQLSAYWSLYEPQTQESYQEIARKLGKLERGGYAWVDCYLPNPKYNN